MCGIAFDLRRPGGVVDEPVLRGSIEVLCHRGPDGRQVWTSPDGSIGLAHARLSIVDLSPAGNQPLANEDKTLWLTANGEIYNHRALREELEASGHEFASSSDCEVFLHGYEEWGLDLLSRIRGMFAFALADVRTGRVLIARDRIGEKPLVYLDDDEGLFGASEIPALRATGRVPDDLDPRALSYFLARNLRHVPEPLSIFAAVRKLRPAHYLVVEGGRIAEHDRWWQPTWGGKGGEARLEKRLKQAVELERLADVEVGALLSGGIDSSIVVGLASSNRTDPLRTYALGRDDQDPELQRARAASERFGTVHHEATFQATQLDRLDDLIAQLGEPIALLPLTHADVLLRAVAEDGLRVVLTGNGSDELFYGYGGAATLRRGSALIRLLAAFPSGVCRRLASGGRVPARARLAARLALEPLHERKTALYRQEVQEAAELLRPELRADALMPAECPVFSPWSEAFEGSSYAELSQFLTLMVEDAHSVTISGDLVGMHHSVEMRAPFLEGEVVDAALALPPWRKGGPLLRPRAKRVLKRSFGRLIGRRTVEAPKMGFGYSLQEGDLIRGQLRERFEERIRGGAGIERYFERGKIIQLLDEHLDGRAENGKLLLSLYAFECWYQQVLGRGRPAPASVAG